MKIEPLKSFEYNKLTSESFNYSFENKAMMAIPSLQPVAYCPYIVSGLDIAVCSVSLLSLITILCSGVIIMQNKKESEKNDSKFFSKRYVIIQLIVAILFFVGSLPFIILFIQSVTSADEVVFFG